MKKAKAMYSSNAQMVAVFVAGLAVATLGWYYSDRLNIAFGQSAEINLISSPASALSSSGVSCMPGDKTLVSRQLEGCELITKTVTCLPVQKYLISVKTRSGSESYESTIPKRFSKPITKFETSTHEKRSLIESELAMLESEIANFKKNTDTRLLIQDEQYKALTTSRAEILQLRRSMIPSKCPPGLITR